jgi:hypothetical protein
MTRWIFHIAALLLLVLTSSKSAVSQAGSAELTGEIVDGAGAVLPNAKVTASELQSGVSSETNSGGRSFCFHQFASRVICGKRGGCWVQNACPERRNARYR